MTYGFQVFNNNQDVLVNDKDFNWGLAAEGTLTFTSINSTTKYSDFQTIDASGIPASGPPPLVFFRVTNSRRAVIVKMDRFVPSGQGVTRWAPTITIVDTPYSVGDPFPVTVEYRVYGLMSNVPVPSGQNWGLVVYDQSGKVTFDSRLKPAVVVDLLNSNFPNWDGNHSSNSVAIGFTNFQPSAVSGLGTPWIATNDVIPEGTYSGVYYNPSSQRNYFDSAYQVLNNKFGARYVVYYPSYNVPQNNQPLHYSNTSNKNYKIFIMKGTSIGLTGWINKLSGTTSCTGNGCQTSEDFLVEWVGGNSNSVTDTWELLNPTSGNFSLSYPYVNGARVNLTNVNTGTYTATLRCTLSQGGSSSITIDYPISRTHTSFSINNPMGFNNNTYNDIGSPSGGLSVTAYSDGTVLIVGSNFGTLWSGNWGTPTTTNIGSSYWIRFEVVSTSGSGAGTTWTATTGWLQLNASREAVVTAIGSTNFSRTRTTVYDVKIASDSAGTNVVSTTRVTLSVTGEAFGEQ